MFALGKSRAEKVSKETKGLKEVMRKYQVNGSLRMESLLR
jgi:hypothetical protein